MIDFHGSPYSQGRVGSPLRSKHHRRLFFFFLIRHRRLLVDGDLKIVIDYVTNKCSIK